MGITVIYGLERLFPSQVLPDGYKFHFRRNDSPARIMPLRHGCSPRSLKAASLFRFHHLHIAAGRDPGSAQGGKPLLCGSFISLVSPRAGTIVHAHGVIGVGGAVRQQGVAQENFPHGNLHVRMQMARNINAAGPGIGQFGGIVHSMDALFKYRQRKNKRREKRAGPFDRTPCGGIIRIRFEGFRANGMPPRNLSLYCLAPLPNLKTG